MRGKGLSLEWAAVPLQLCEGQGELKPHMKHVSAADRFCKRALCQAGLLNHYCPCCPLLLLPLLLLLPVISLAMPTTLCVLCVVPGRQVVLHHHSPRWPQE